jgi:ribose 5-phosphate isomerase A
MYLVRHGETEWSRARRHTGRTDVPLNEVGEAEAKALGQHLRGLEVDRVLSSPLIRAVTTARLAGFGDRLETTDALLEFDYGDYEGLTTPEIRASRPGWDLFRDGPGPAGRADGRRRPGPAVLPRPPAPHPDRLLPGPASRDGQAPVPGHGQPVGRRHRARVAGHPALERAGGLRRPPGRDRHHRLARCPQVAPPAAGRPRSGPGMTGLLDDPARAAAAAAARPLIEPGMTVGLGSGRAVFALIDVLAATWASPRPLRAVVASSRTEARARAAGIDLVGLDDDRVLDLAVDGADEVDPALRLLKGGGGALLREKLVLAAARRVVIVAEAPKLVDRLGASRALPVEVVRFAWPTTRRRLLDLVPEASLRRGPGGGPVVTDEGHHLLDCAVPAGDLEALAAALKATLGVVEHGLFVDQADQVLLGRPDGTVEELSRPGAAGRSAGDGPSDRRG